MNIANLKIGTRLRFGFGLILFILAGIAALGINAMGKTNDALRHIVDVNVKKMTYTEDMKISTHIVARVIRTVSMLSDESEANIQRMKIDDARKVYNAAFSSLEKMPLSDAGKALLVKIKDYQSAARPLNDKFIEMAKTDKDGAAQFLLKEAGPATTKWQDAMQEFTELQREMDRKDEETSLEDYHFARTLMLSLTSIALVAGAFIAWFISRSITQPIDKAVKIAQTVAAGDLNSIIEVTSTDETGQLLQALKDMNGSLLTIVNQVRAGTETIATASSQIATGNMDLSSRTEQQASSLEETASSMEELTSTVQQNADNARQANSLAKTASEVASKGGDVVSEVVGTMNSISESAKKIVDIISVIDGIAFQTNILALNAAVEAARAREQGRGFAGVAAEVRNLAHRSATAAREIKTLIENSVEKVDSATKLVDQAGLAMKNIVTSIQKVNDVVAEISNASHEQSSGIDQINQAVIHMDETTQQNAALVEQAAAAASSLQDQASKLSQVVSVFKLNAIQGNSSKTTNAKQHPVKMTTKVAQKSEKKVINNVKVLGLGTAEKDNWEEF